MSFLKIKYKQIPMNELKVRAFGKSLINETERYKLIQIKDIPIMITNDGKVLCIPNTGEVKHIGVTGMTGTAKSLTLNSLMSMDYWLVKQPCINLSDFQKETFEWGLETESFKDIHSKINLKPTPTPMVYLFPSTKTLQLDKKDKRFPILKTTIPLEEVIRNIENYHSLDKSKVYLGNLVEDLIECHSMTEIEDVIEDRLHKKHEMMKLKILNIFEALFKNKMLNVTVPEAPSILEVIKQGTSYINFPFISLMWAGFVPSIQTSDLRNHEFFSAYMSFIVEAIYRNQYEDPEFRDKSISLFVDEIDKLWLGHNGHLIKESLNLIGTNGRAARVGLRWATQHYDKVPDQIRTNTKYLFISRKADAKEVNQIRKDFDIPKSMDDDILQLITDRDKGLFELVAVTTESFVLYDLQTGEKTITSIAQKGILIPPIARHKRPGVSI